MESISVTQVLNQGKDCSVKHIVLYHVNRCIWIKSVERVVVLQDAYVTHIYISISLNCEGIQGRMAVSAKNAAEMLIEH